MNLLSKVKTIIWFIQRPVMYSRIWDLIRFRLHPDENEFTRAEATEWCRSQKLSTQEVVAELFKEENLRSFEKENNELILMMEEQLKSIKINLGGPADCTLLYNLLEFTKAKTVVETGVALGWSSACILSSISKRNGKLVSTDMPYPKMNTEDLVGVLVPKKYHDYWELYRMPDKKAFGKFLNGLESVDLCHYDSDKTYTGRMWAYPRLWEKLKKGGVFISDDINDNLAFTNFANRVGRKPYVIFNEPESKYIGVLVK